MKREHYEINFKHQLLGKPYYWTDFPKCIQIDISNFCGQSYSGVCCEYCFPQHEIAAGRDCYTAMPEEWVEYIIRQFHKYGSRKPSDPYKSGIAEFVTFFLNGDGETDPRLPDIARMSKRIAPWLTTQTFTCGANPQNAGWLCTPELDWVCVTVSAPNRELYRIVHGGDRFDDALKTLQYLQDNAPSSTKLEVHYVITKHNIGGMKAWWDLMGERFPRFKRVFSPLVDSSTNIWSHNAMGGLTLEEQENAIYRISKAQFWDHRTTGFRQPCVLWNNFSVKADLTLLQCCNWADPAIWNYGKLPQIVEMGLDLRDVWLMRLANKQNNPLCATCNLKHPDWKKRLNFDVKVKLK
ncbi:MAG: hypothetical protein ACQXXJ_06080 [Candidatus Bathyarchaeia archaeon]